MRRAQWVATEVRGWYGLGMEDPDQDGGGEEQAAVDPARVGALLGVDGVLREA